MDPNDNSLAGQGPQMPEPATPTPQNGFGGGIQDTTPNPTQTPPLVQEPAVTPQPTTQQTSPLDPPPPPMAGAPEAAQDLKEVITPSKPKGKFPVLAILIVLIVLVLGGVGYLAYQNSQLKSKTATTPSGNTINPLATPFATPTSDPYSNFKTVTGESIPIEVMIPNDWTVEQTENAELGNQKMIDAKSADFAYEGASVSAGYEFRIGPVSDLTKKYDSFEEFSAEANIDGTYDIVVYNQVKFLKKGTTAQTLIDKTPVSIALYTSPANETNSIILFNKILTTFKLITTSNVTGMPASPSAIPSM